MLNLANIHKGEGGAHHQLALASYFIEQGHEVLLVSPGRDSSGPAPAIFEQAGICSPSLTRIGLPGSFDTLMQIPLLLWYRLVRRYNVLYIRAVPFAVVANIIARLLGMKVILEHNGWQAIEREERGGGPLMASIEHILQVTAARTAHMNRTVTRGLQRILLDAGVSASRVIAIGNGTDLTRFYPIAREEALASLGWDNNLKYIGFLGGVVSWQGLENALRAFALVEGREKLRLVIAGDGPELKKLENLAEDLGISGQTDFPGYIDRDQANLLINGFDIAIAPFSQSYCMKIGLSSTKIRDYAAAGRIIICADIPELLENEAGDWIRMHKPDDAQDLARLLVQTLAETGDSDSKQRSARQYAEQYFDWKMIAARVMDLIKGVSAR